MIQSRRDLLTAASAAALAGLAEPAFAAAKKTALSPNAAADALINRIANRMIDESPETATYLGLDHGPRARLKGMLSDNSWAAV